MSGFDPHEGPPRLEDGVERADGFTAIDISDIIDQLSAPFADIDIPSGFEHLLEARLGVTALLLKGLKSSVHPEQELHRLEAAALEAVLQKKLADKGSGFDRVIAGDYETKKRSFRLELGDRTELAERFTEISDSSRLSHIRQDSSWGFEREYEPFEHTGIEAVGMNITTNPRAGRSEASLHMHIHPEVAVDEEDSIIGALLQVRKVGHEVFRYQVPMLKEESYRTRRGKGRGLVYEAEDGSRITIEMSGHSLKMSYSVAIQKPKSADETGPKLTTDSAVEITEGEAQKDKEARAHADLKAAVEKQLDFVQEQFPAFIQHVSDIWGKSLPDESITIQVGSHTGKLGLFEADEDNEIDEDSIPEEVTDQRQKSLYLQTVRPNPKTSFEMVGGLNDEVRRVKQAISKAMHPERYELVGLDPRATVLLVGPPGTGKTMIAEAVATEIDGIFLAVKGSDIMSMWAGEAEKNVAGLFDLVEVLGKEQKVVLFLDEIEAVAPSRAGQHMMEHERKVTAEFLAALNRKYPNAIIIGATNAPANVDAAVTRPGRFTDIITVGNPDQVGRLHIINNWLDYYRGRASVEVFNGISPEELAEASDGLNGADLKTIIETALVNEVEQALEEDREFRSLGTTALLGHIKTHKLVAAERFANYLGDPNNPLGVLVRKS